MSAPADPARSVDPLGTGDPGPGVLAAVLERVLAQEPAAHAELLGDPRRLWGVAERVLDEVEAARDEQAQIAYHLDRVAGGLM